jgi:hypothetical protein
LRIEELGDRLPKFSLDGKLTNGLQVSGIDPFEPAAASEETHAGGKA